MTEEQLVQHLRTDPENALGYCQRFADFLEERGELERARLFRHGWACMWSDGQLQAANGVVVGKIQREQNDKRFMARISGRPAALGPRKPRDEHSRVESSRKRAMRWVERQCEWVPLIC